MTLYTVLHTIPGGETVTVYDYITSEILIDCEAVANVLESDKFHEELKRCEVYKLQAGKEFGDLQIGIVA